MTEYNVIEAPDDDAETTVLSALADHQPYAYVVARKLDPLDLHLASNHDVPTIRALLNQALRALPGGMKDVSDGHHTFDELYDHRRALTAVLAASATSDGSAWRSKEHHPDDDLMYEDCFIVGIELPTGTITYHYGLACWDDFAAVPERAHAPKWDGAPPAATVDRLLELVRLAGTVTTTDE